MSERKGSVSGKAVQPSYDNKAVASATAAPSSVKIRVIKAHDGLKVGEVYQKPIDAARQMQELGYWKII